ncbi:general transcription factor 3C polypeptide 2 [Larimichthys crocea]|uniref:general transcription factor 3C polypeptide 2 n=1 Tax=Larimichthys crocea TaxID=215358 RepID=UPI000901C7F7|nr:general transcription factor 3C polypeptide 2 [Larimichthys crocea]
MQMDPIDSGQGQETPTEQCCDSTPTNNGRRRKKNPKYFDYETNDTSNVQSVQQKTPRRSSGRKRGAAAASKRTPAKGGEAENASPQAEDGEATGETPQTDENSSKETPKKVVRAKRTPAKRTPGRKTPAKKTPAKKTPIADGGFPTEDGGAVDPVQQENGKPKRKYVRRRPVQELVTEPPCKEVQGEPPTEPEEEIQPGGRRRRGAAKAALKYLHLLAKEVFSHPGDESDSQEGANSDGTHSEPGHKGLRDSKGRRGRKRKRADSDSDPAEDEDFVPDVDEEEAQEMEEDDEEEEEGVDSDTDSDFGGRGSATFHVNRTYAGPNLKTANGLTTNIMKTVWEATETTKKFREEHYSSWVFPEWVPSTSDWHPVPQSDLERYLPQEVQSAAFKVSREGLSQEETPLQRLDRFSAEPAHSDRWDMLLFAGGPVWAMEWCPTPDGAPASQHIALACHRGMDDQHQVNKTYTGQGLVQLWDVGKLEYNSRPDSLPALAYGLAQDKGFIWHLKWCPAGGWEPPSCDRKAPFLPRLGLLAVATSTCVVTIYSLPHPDALHSSKTPANRGKSSQPSIFQAEGVLTLKLGSFKAPRNESSGQVLSMDWLPEKPHNIIAIGFYDGVVGLWDLATKSALLRVREPDKSLSLLPYRCLLAHDHAVRALAFCPASRHLLVTAGEDRYVKTWDLRRLYNPIAVLKRFLTNEIYWPLNAPGILFAQENAYAAYGSHGVHYFDHNARTFFAAPRTGTLWSISYTEWMNGVVTSDSLGEVILALLPQLCYSPQYVKRTLERRFPVYLTSLVPYDPTKGENQEMGGEEEEQEEEGGDAVEEQEGGGETEGPDAASENVGDGGKGRKAKNTPLRFQKYKEAAKRYYLHHTDNDMTTFVGSEKRAVWKRMKDTEVKMKMNMDDLPLAAIHKVRFNPNMCSHTWVVSAGRTGLVRLNCLRGMITPQVKKIISKNQAQFNALYTPKDQEEAVQTVTDDDDDGL